jgi:hypothetical protein
VPAPARNLGLLRQLQMTVGIADPLGTERAE